MLMWIMIALFSLLLAVLSVIYLVNRVGKLGFIQWISKKHKKIRYGISAIFVFAFMGLLTWWISFVNMIIIIIHLVVFWVVIDLLGFIINIFRKKKRNYSLHCLIVVLVTALYLGYGLFSLYNVQETRYSIDSDKINGKGYRIVQITDTHIGTSLDQESFLENIERINKLKPDVVVITGDYVDDATSYEEFMACTKALKKLKAKKGVYFVFGNHDKGYGNSKGRGFTYKDIKRELRRSHVKVLEDKNVLIDKTFYLIGRQDAMEKNRADMKKLLKNVDSEKYQVVLDHEPNDYQAEMDAGVDLVLSGHTHGGQMIPIIHVGEWIGANDMTYGHERRGETDFIVSSGMSDWELQFKTGCISEYVVIDLK